MSDTSHANYKLIVSVKNQTLLKRKKKAELMFVLCKKLQLRKFNIDKIGCSRESVFISPSINVLILLKLALNLVRSKFHYILEFKYVSHYHKLFRSDLFEA